MISIHCNIQNCPLIDKRSCTSVGSIYIRNVLCHKYECPSKWRLCPSCISQGDVSRVEYKDEIFSIGYTINGDCMLCEFHSNYGATARRGDANLIRLETMEMFFPLKTETLRTEKSVFKIVPIPLLSEFDYEYHDRIRKIVSAGLRGASCEIKLEEKESLASLEASMQEFYDANADMLSEIEIFHSIEDFLSD